MSISFNALDSNNAQILDFGRGPFTAPALLDIEGWEFGGPNFHNAGGAVIIHILSEATDRALDTVSGQVTIHEALRALMAAGHLFDRLAPQHVVEPSVVHGAPRTNEDGTVELRPVRLIDCGLSLEGIERRFDELVSFVDLAAQAGATDISWG